MSNVYYALNVSDINTNGNNFLFVKNNYAWFRYVGSAVG